jgi:hypothetical protein
VTDDYISVKQRARTCLFLLRPGVDYEKLNLGTPLIIYSQVPLEGVSKQWKEAIYDLEALFKLNYKELRRGISLRDRKEIEFKDSTESKEDFNTIHKIFTYWKDWKEANPKVFKMTFNPNRYYRSYMLKVKSPLGPLQIYEKIIYVNGEPYGVINFSIEDGVAFELSFVSRFFDPNLRFINDLSECIIISCFYDLYKNYGIKKVNVGTDAGIKGLKAFKNKIPHDYCVIYSN